MANKIIGYLDESPSTCMYPMDGESDEEFRKRLDHLRKERRAKMSPEDIRLVEKTLNGTLTKKDLEKRVVAVFAQAGA